MATKRTKHELMAPKRTGKSASKPSKDAVLTLKVTGPGVKKGRITVPDLIKICQDTQSAVNRQAEALAGEKRCTPVRSRVSLETSVRWSLLKSATEVPNWTSALRSHRCCCQMRRASDRRSFTNWQTLLSPSATSTKTDLDPGVLQSIYGLGGITESGRINTLKWMTPKASKRVVAPVNKKVRERAAVQLSRPTFKFTRIDGVLDMVDFSRRDRKCRIDPAIGAPVSCAFGPEHENEVHALLRQPVRVSGTARIQPGTERVDVLDIVKLEALTVA